VDLEALEELAEKYALLIALGQGEPGRTSARRDEMREIAARFPGALREWDELPGELAARRAVVEELRAAVASRPEAAASLIAAAPGWLRYALVLHPLLGEVLAVKRWLAAEVGGVCDAVTPELTTAFIDWYGRRRTRVRAAQRCADWFTHDRLAEVARPPGGQITRLAYAAVAAEFGVTVSAVKAALYGAEADAEDR
jgi:hypothetical protein